MKLRRVAIALAIVAGIVAVVVLEKRASKRHSQTMSLRLQWVHQSQFAGFYVAKERGFYRDVGLDLSIEQGGKDVNVPMLVAEGRADFGIWAGDQVLRGYEHTPTPIRAVGTVFNRSLVCFMVRADSAIHGPKDFLGKTVGVYPDLDSENIYLELLRNSNLDRAAIKEYPAAYSIVPFLRGEVDVWPSYVINEPLAARAHGQPVRCLTPDMFDIKYYSDTIVVKDSTLRERRSMVVSFLEASERGWRYALSHPEEAVAIVLKYDPSLNKEHELAMLKAEAEYISPTNPLFKMDPEVWKAMAEMLHSRGVIDDVTSYQRLPDFQIAEEGDKQHKD